MPGILYLIPNTLGQTEVADTDPLAHIIPQEVQASPPDSITSSPKTPRPRAPSSN